jgi:formate hydrogenlyase subunit 3/multisubunit Na+/H+ antiporter MnhD subunit
MIRKKDFIKILCKICLVLVISPLLASAYEDPDENEWTTSSGVDVEELIILGSSILAIALFAITIIAYNRDRRKKLLYVAVAFFFFAVKGILLSSDIFIPDKVAWIDPLAVFLDFIILLSFFFGILKK